jgi:hypothetical protein
MSKIKTNTKICHESQGNSVYRQSYALDKWGSILGRGNDMGFLSLPL